MNFPWAETYRVERILSSDRSKQGRACIIVRSPRFMKIFEAVLETNDTYERTNEKSLLDFPCYVNYKRSLRNNYYNNVR